MADNHLFLGSLLLLIGLCSLSTIIQHDLLNTLYLLDRTALFLLVLFNLIFVFFIAEITKEKKKAQWLIHLSALIVLIHFFITLNLSYVLEWKLDSDTKDMLTELEKTKTIPVGKETISIGISLVFDPAINFYREKNNLTWINTAWRSQGTSLLHDYFCLTKSDLLSMNKDSIEIIKTYPRTENVLAKRKYPPKEIKALVSTEMNFEKEPEHHYVFNEETEYGPTFSYTVNDSVTPDRNAVFAFYADVIASDLKKDNLLMVISFQNAKGDVYSWQNAYVKDYIKTKNQLYHASFTCIVPQETQQGDEIKSYIWNPEKQKLVIKKMQFKWLAYKN